MGEGLDVVDEGRPAVHTALRGERRLHRGPGVAPAQEPGEGRLLARDVPVRDLGDTHIDRIGPGALREGGRDPGDLQPTFAQAQHRVPRTHRGGGQHDPVDHEVRGDLRATRGP